jgi:hypothetical protein
MIADDTDRLCSAADGTWANPGRSSQATGAGREDAILWATLGPAGMGSHQSRSRFGRLASSSAIVGTRAMLQ